jgi:hypothetical protein
MSAARSIVSDFDFDSDFDSEFEFETNSVKRKWNVDKAVENVDLIEDGEIEAIEERLEIHSLRERLGGSLRSLDQLRPPAGLATGIDIFDNFLLWRGLPKGDLTLLSGQPGGGATSLWIHTAQKIHQENKWVAWINSDWELLPSHLVNKKIDLKRLLVVKKPKELQNMFMILQELITSSLFEMVGCHLPETLLKNHQLHKLKKLARTHQVALVIVSHAKQWTSLPIFSLVIDCARDFFTVKRALHRPTPFSIEGSLIHADFRNQSTSSTRSLMC